MIYNHLKNRTFLLLLASFFSLTTLVAQPTIENGKTLFKANCATCHAKDMKTAATGPALGGAEERWADFPQSDLYSWIRNSAALIATGHPRATALYAEWNASNMTAFKTLTDDDIASLLMYVDGVYEGTYPPQVAVVGGGGDVKEASSFGWLYWGLLAVLGLLALLLFRVTSSLGQIASEKTGGKFVPKSLLESLSSSGVIGFAIFALVVFLGYTTVNNAVGLGRQQGYAPEQPIKFSHETHAGVNQIDCKYCHDGARRSKHAVIPAANTCMNCHRAITKGSEYGTGEITKIFASVGFDPSKNAYIEEGKTDDELKAIYTKWIADQYLAEAGLEELDSKGEKLVANQWSEIVSSLTNEQKTEIQGPIEWIRVHNLPDHVYFNHAQHVTVGKLECQECHGKVEEMKLLEQSAPLSMGWCINCHRKTEVQFSDNEYYESYVKYHDDIESGEKKKVTVQDIGGLECQKCHY
jgi:mono/diheme cytochrome c family protein